MFTRGGSAPGGVASTHARQAVTLCTDPHMPVQRTATPTLRPTHTHSDVSPRTHIALAPAPDRTLAPGLQPPCLTPQKASDIWADAAPQFQAGLPSAACLPLRRSAEKVKGFTTARNDRRSR